MKTIFKYILAVAAGLFALAVSSAFAQDPGTLEETIKMYKRIAPTSVEGKYEITLEGFITSTSIVTEITEPIDIVMVIDRSVAVNSHKMNGNVVTACETFVNTVYELSPKDSSMPTHDIAMVSFGGDSNQLVTVDYSMGPLTTERRDAMLSTINHWITGGSDWKGNTVADQGLAKAEEIMSERTGDRKKVVLFFTAGAPKENSGQSGTDYFHTPAGIRAVNSSYNLKQLANLTVYSVAPENNIDSKGVPAGTRDEVRYFNYVSSNYKFQITTQDYDFQSNYSAAPAPGGAEAAHDYYRTCAADGADLSDIFKKIAQEAAGDIVPLHETTTAVVDIVSDNFLIPNEITDDNIQDKVTLEVWKVDPDNSYDASKKDTPFDPVLDENGKVIDGYYNGIHFVYDSEYTADHPLEAHRAGNRLQISGFDFAKADDKYTEGQNIGVPIYGSGNWVGPRNINKQDIYWGRKIVIKFTVELNPDYQGGYVMPSNDLNSGFYIDTDGDEVFDEDELIKPFPVPNVDFPSICIVKDGLKVNESAIFTVTYPDNTKHNVILTQRVDKNGAILPCYAVLKRLNEGVYTVKETNWSWMYEAAEDTTKELSYTVVNGENSGITTDYLLSDATGAPLTVKGLEIGRQGSKDVLIDGRYVSTPFCLLKDLDGEYISSAVSVLYYFSNERVQTGKPARAEAYAHNQFAGGKASGGTETGGSEEEDM